MAGNEGPLRPPKGEMETTDVCAVGYLFTIMNH